jgi:hypothetical protein
MCAVKGTAAMVTTAAPLPSQPRDERRSAATKPATSTRAFPRRRPRGTMARCWRLSDDCPRAQLPSTPVVVDSWESHAVCAALSFQQCLERISLQDWLLILEVSSASGYKPSAKFVVIGLIVLTSVGVSHGPSCELVFADKLFCSLQRSGIRSSVRNQRLGALL